MYYSEFLSIYHGTVAKLPTWARLDLAVECVKRYLQRQDVTKPKPCVFLGGDNMCRTYEFRPLKCRLYGLIPDSLYEWVVSKVSSESGVPKADIPLCVQCPFVKIKPEYAGAFSSGKIPEEMIREIERKLRANDASLGIGEELQANEFSFLTYHDWHIMFELGEGWMALLTPLRLNLEEEKKEQFVASLKEALAPLYDAPNQEA
jgi:Fe-S-cluster containining protein